MKDEIRGRRRRQPGRDTHKPLGVTKGGTLVYGVGGAEESDSSTVGMSIGDRESLRDSRRSGKVRA